MGFQFTYEELSNEIEGISPTTIWRMVKHMGWREVKKRSRPSLSTDQITQRLKWAKAHRRETWTDHVDIDEKFFLVTTPNRPLKVPPGMQPPADILQSKTNITKVMFIIAVARPRAEFNFNGKIGLWRVAIPYEVKRKSKNHQRGETYEKDCTLDAELFGHVMATKIFPAIRRKMKFSRNINVQLDNAKPHTGKSVPQLLQAAGQSKTSKSATPNLIFQPPQSPDTNALDLGFNRSLNTRVCRAQRSSTKRNLEELVRQVRREWRIYPPHTLAKVFDSKTRVLKSIIRAKGRNDYTLPRTKSKSILA